MSAYCFIKVTAVIGTDTRTACVTTPLRVPQSIARMVQTSDDSVATSCQADAIARAEFVRAGLLTPGEATLATFSYASVWGCYPASAINYPRGSAWRDKLARQNRLRSPTAEQVFSRREDLEVDSAGTNHDADNPLIPLVFTVRNRVWNASTGRT